MDDSLYLLPYRLAELKPDALDTLKDRVSSVTTPIQDFILLYLFFPYARYALAPLVTLLIVVLPIGALLAIPATLIVGVPTMAGYISTLVSSPLYLAGILTGMYSLAALRYKPTDKKDYLTVSTPTDYEEWEIMLTVMAFGVLPTTYFSLLYFEELSIVMELTRLSAFVLSWIAFVFAFILFYYWMHHRYGAGRTVATQMDTVQGFLGFFVLGMGTYLSLVAFGVDFLVYGSGVGAVFVVHLATMVFLARRLRWAAYTDWAGYGLSPYFPLWGLVSRGPLVFAVYILVFGEGLSMIVAGASFSPLVAAIGYISWRAYVTGDLKEPPTGWVSSPGRKQYEKTRKSNKKKMEKTEEVRQAVVEFNEFASSHGLSTLTEPDSIIVANVETIRKELKSIHQYEARELSGDAYTEYIDLRKDLLDEL